MTTDNKKPDEAVGYRTAPIVYTIMHPEIGGAFDVVSASAYSALKEQLAALKAECERLTAQNADLRAALEYYSDSDNWGHMRPTETTYSVIGNEDLGDGSFQLSENVDDERVGGKLARTTLAKYKKESGE